MRRRRRIAIAVAAVLVTTASLVALASVTGVPPGGRVRIELFEPRANGGNPPVAVTAGVSVGKLERDDPEHWGGSFIRGNAYVVRYVDVSESAARAALSEAGVVGRVTLEPGTVSLAEADDLRGRIEATGLMGTRILGLGFDPERALVEVEARRPGLGLVRRIDEATAGSDIPVRIHWLLGTPQAL